MFKENKPIASFLKGATNKKQAFDIDVNQKIFKLFEELENNLSDLKQLLVCTELNDCAEKESNSSSQAVDDDIDKPMLYNLTQIAKIFGVTTMTIRRWIKSRPDFPQPFYLSDSIRSIRFTKASIDQYIKSLQ